MSLRSGLFGAILLAAGLVAGSGAVDAASPAQPQLEVEYLLKFIASSGCEFYRNGTAYDAVRAAAHLRDKYAAQGPAGGVQTAEAFIDTIASRSSFTGRNYEVRCGGKERVWTAPWLRDALDRFRSGGASRG